MYISAVVVQRAQARSKRNRHSTRRVVFRVQQNTADNKVDGPLPPPTEALTGRHPISLHVAEVDLLVDSARSDEGSIEGLGVVGGHDHDAPGSVHDAVQHVQETLRPTRDENAQTRSKTEQENKIKVSKGNL